MVVTHEVGEQGTPHLNVKVTLLKGRRFEFMKKLVPRGHIEASIMGDALYQKKVNDTDRILFEVDHRKQGHRTDLDNAIADIKNGASVQQMWSTHTSAMVKFHRGLLEAKAQLHPRSCTSQFTEWRWPPIEDFSKSIIIHGAPGIGKTEYAKQHFKHALLVTHIDNLLEFCPEVHDGIVFDDMTFVKLHRTSQIHLVDMTNDNSIHCRFRAALIPAGTRRIFTANNLEELFDLNDGAIHRRVSIISVIEVPKGNTMSFGTISDRTERCVAFRGDP